MEIIPTFVLLFLSYKDELSWLELAFFLLEWYYEIGRCYYNNSSQKWVAEYLGRESF